TQAFTTLGDGYAFDTTITVAGTVATEAKGRWTSGNSEFVVTTGGTSITYRTIPPNSWVLEAGKPWVAVDGQIPSGDPLDALSKPTSAEVISTDASGTRIAAVYPAASLGLAGSKPVSVDLTIAPDSSITARYDAPLTTASGSAAPSPGGTASAQTVLTPSPNQPAIAVPDLGSAAPSS
ncbi:MAG: hypothetical protein ACHQ3P_03590, partial [Candidatus Limnocylindrales bacterium]